MTHDELLALLDKHMAFAEGFGPDVVRALRAVVELHKPNEFGDCSICVIRTVIDLGVASYPCPTIQAIKKELL